MSTARLPDHHRRRSCASDLAAAQPRKGGPPLSLGQGEPTPFSERSIMRKTDGMVRCASAKGAILVSFRRTGSERFMCRAHKKRCRKKAAASLVRRGQVLAGVNPAG